MQYTNFVNVQFDVARFSFSKWKITFLMTLFIQENQIKVYENKMLIVDHDWIKFTSVFDNKHVYSRPDRYGI